ncbi:ABC transporter permease subunit [Rhizobium sp. T1470]|uniref:ABC transporter permease n=1 Tax=unclassified Rhizobium TaxID=2613769 RepID=UPI001CD4A091|nr:ABC transporter permease subunit [Rhizobium sp. T1473]MCA0801608.1 ABC transporter permease subunit [Rhizobium sp. T1473]
MDISSFTDTFDEWTDAALEWVGDNGESLFDYVRWVLEGLYDGILWLLELPPFYVVAIVVALVGWRVVNAWFAILSGVALMLCFSMGLWSETMSTLALVLTATVLALAIGIPIGIAAGFFTALDRFMEPGLDLIQTLPPYIYLLPAIALLGYGPATALIATVVVAMPPAIRLTSLGIRMTPKAFIELGEANGITPGQMFFKIRLPFALPSIMAGINQSLMMAFGMVVIAGIVGSGGLGETIYGAIRTLDIATSINGAIAIVVLTMVVGFHAELIPTSANQNRCAQSRIPIDMIFHG